MKALKSLEIRLIAELTRNSRRSDRELAHILKVSQPTISRIRTRLEKEKMIDYGGFPDLAKLGYEIIAVTLGKRNYEKYPESVVQKARHFTESHANLIFGSDCSGAYDTIAISVHKSYSDYHEFIQELKSEAGEAMPVDSVLISLSKNEIVQPLSLKRLVDHMAKKQG